MRWLVDKLGFLVEKRAGIDVLVWEGHRHSDRDGGCRPAFSTESAMWARIKELKEAGHELVSACVSETEHCSVCREDIRRHASGCTVQAMRDALAGAGVSGEGGEKP